VSSPNSGRYFVEILTGTGQTYTDDIEIIFYGVPGPVGVNILRELSDSNDVEIVVSGGGSYEYSVNGGPFQDSPIFTDLPPGENTVVVNDTNGCGATEPIPFLVVGYPKFFTPNGDGINDGWNIQGIETLTDPVVFIFDRYGKLLKQLDESSAGWDGTFNGRPMPSSDYWFRLEYTRQESGQQLTEVLRSHFSLKR
jgi:gliding motility-associated-like protein